MTTLDLGTSLYFNQVGSSLSILSELPFFTVQEEKAGWSSVGLADRNVELGELSKLNYIQLFISNQ